MHLKKSKTNNHTTILKFFIKKITLFMIVFLGVSCSNEADLFIDPDSKDILIQSIQIAGENIINGGESQFIATILPENATNKSIVWESSNTEIATVSKEGLVTAVSNGTIMLSVEAKDASGIKVKKSVLVSGKQIGVESIKIKGARNITDAQPLQLTVDVLPTNSTNKSVSWTVSDSSIGTISDLGLLTPSNNGQITVTAMSMANQNATDTVALEISGFNDPDEGLATSEEIRNAIDVAKPGDVIIIQEGTYSFSTKLSITKVGSSSQPILMQANPSHTNRVIFDFSQMAVQSSNRGISVSGSYWHIQGIDVKNAGDNGMFISGSNNTIENCAFYNNKDTGLQLGNSAANNLILNCDSYDNIDPSNENADGFAAKMDVGSNNTFDGCRAWNNSDDGYDGYLRGTDNVTTVYKNCWAFLNGYFSSGGRTGGDGNGFKTGGSDDKLLKHHVVMTQCVAAGNAVDGFDHNSNRGDVLIDNASAYKNGRNISFGSTNIASKLVVRNSMSFAGSSSDSFKATTTTISNNSWQNGLTASANDVVSVDINLLKSPRNVDGTLPEIDFLKLNPLSPLIDQGIDVGIPYFGNAPDIGAFELK